MVARPGFDARLATAPNESNIWRKWFQELGISVVYIDPFNNFTSVKQGEKWIGPRPGTDSALMEAIAYVWLTEDTYDKDYVKKHVHRFEEWADHILGKGADKTPKTPQWAQDVSGVRAPVIKALARRWASTNTMGGSGVRVGWGGACRTDGGTDYARLLVQLFAMQGMGKPGRGMWTAHAGAPLDYNFWFAGYSDPKGSIANQPIADHAAINKVEQRLYRPEHTGCHSQRARRMAGRRLLRNRSGAAIQEACLSASGLQQGAHVLPLRRKHSSARCSTPTNGVKMYQEPGAGIRRQPGHAPVPRGQVRRRHTPGLHQPRTHPTSASSATAATVAMPRTARAATTGRSSSTRRRRSNRSANRAATTGYSANWRSDSASGRTSPEVRDEEGWCKRFWETSDLCKRIGWEEFKQRGYYIPGIPEDWERRWAFRWFADGSECKMAVRDCQREGKLGTTTGKFEFVLGDARGTHAGRSGAHPDGQPQAESRRALLRAVQEVPLCR